MIEAAPLDTLIRTLADPTRRAVFERIVRSEGISVTELTRDSGVTQSAVSSTICVSLKQANCAIDRAQGRNVFYQAQPEGLAPLFDWMSHYGIFWRDRFADLRSLLKEIDHD